MLEGIRHPYFHCIQTENETQEASLALKKSGASEEEVFFPCCMFLRESLGLQSRKMCRFVTSYSFLRMTATHYFLSANWESSQDLYLHSVKEIYYWLDKPSLAIGGSEQIK